MARGRSSTGRSASSSRRKHSVIFCTRGPKRPNREPRTSLDEMIAEMVENDLAIAKKNRLLRESDYEVNHARE